LKSYACKQMENVPGDDSVWCWVKIADGARILVGCIYRSPTSSVENNELIMNQIVKASEVADQNRILLMGDFNVKEINWIEVEATGGEESLPYRFNECIKDCFLHQHVLVPTRYKGEQQESTLDLIFTKEEEDIRNIEVFKPLGKSDHGVVICDLICEWKANAIFVPKRLYHKANYEIINRLINEVNWEAEFEGKNIHQRWICFKNKLEEILSQHVPMSEPKKYQAPWMNRRVRKAYRKKLKAWQRYLEHKRSARWREYVQERNLASKIE
ncbi:unnamed protein product, partial [Meganyctiphanes norvegica]